MNMHMLKSGKQLIIRNVEITDAEPFIHYLEQIAGESDNLSFGSGELSITVEQQQETIKKFQSEKNHLFLMAEVDGEIVGNITFRGGSRIRTQHAGEFGISVVKDYWGFGIGRLLIESMFAWAKENGLIKKINLRVRADNEAGIHLYKKLGFIEEGRVSRDFMIDGKYYDCIHMGIEFD